MPSYASVAAKDLPPSTEWPQPDPNLLSTEAPSGSHVVDDSAKVAVVSSDFKEHPQSEFTENIRQNVPQESSGTRVPMPTLKDDIISQPVPAQPSKARRAGHKAKAEAVSIWDHATNFLLRPGVAGGLIGLGRLLQALYCNLCSDPYLNSQRGTPDWRCLLVLLKTPSSSRYRCHQHCYCLWIGSLASGGISR
jgi:hypothetical protein